MRGPLLFITVALLSISTMSHTQASVAPPGGNSEITLQFVVRDFVGIYKTGTPAGRNRTTHPDFERVSVAEKGIILPFLGPDRNPQRNLSVDSKSWTNTTCFNWAWNDVPGVNYRLTRSFTLLWNTTTGLYTSASSAFFPIDNDGFGNFGSTGKNFHFCLVLRTQFLYNGNEQFKVTGDDDVYVFINNRLFVDLGGIHAPLTAERQLVNTTTAFSNFGMIVGGLYDFDLFCCERHTTGSNLTLSTNLQLNACPFLDACGDCSATKPLKSDNPCSTLQCNNGVCNCRNASCVCQAGWVDGPMGNCSQNCGDGTIQGSEECDPPGPCCSSQCKFAAANLTCPSGGRSCINYVCTGTSSVCGTPRIAGTSCSGLTILPQCQRYQCTGGGECEPAVNVNLTCTDNDPCTTDVCTVTGVCLSTALQCSASACREAGTCNSSTGQCSLGAPKTDGIGCGADPGATNCTWLTCLAGDCRLTPKPINTRCGSDAEDGCSTRACNAIGSCAAYAIPDKQGNIANCSQPSLGQCFQSICSGLGCVNSPLADGSSCTAALTLNSCQRRGCVDGVCTVLPESAREGQTCTDGGALASFGDDQCNVKVCTNGQCVRKADTARDGTNCSITSSGAANPEQQCRTYKCQAGTCARANVNEGSVCTNSSLTTNNCQRLQCTTGTCSVRPFNANGQCAASINNGCTFYRCDDVGNCNLQFAPVNISCGPTNLKCNLTFCTSTGTCVQRPVLCDTQVCGGKLKCNQTLGVCEIPAGEIVSCCGNGIIDTAAEECDDPTDPCCVNCLWATPLTPCGATNECNPKRCTLVTPAPSKITRCSNNYQNNIPCANAPSASNQCKQLRCGNNTDVCSEVNKFDDTPCTLSDVPFCGEAVCRSGACTVVPLLARADQDCSSAYGPVPECNVAMCSGTACILKPTNPDGDCTVLPATECRDRKCKAGKCEYTVDAYPKSLATTCTSLTSNTKCQQPGCDGFGNCVLLNVTAGVGCDRAFNAECNVPECDGGGLCALKSINVGNACTAARDQQCQVSKCSASGTCAVENAKNGTPCMRIDVGQCQDAECSNGACMLVNTTVVKRLCEPTPNPREDRSCLLYYCQSDGTCEVPTKRDDGTLCTDSNLCDVDTCKDGVCLHEVNVVCNQPNLPCEQPIGACVPAFGNCSYFARGQYSSCTPRAFEVNSRCNSSTLGLYLCLSGAADSVCAASCFVSGVCGDGLVQDGEECDWGDARTGGPCCDDTCKWFAEQATCADSDTSKIAAQITQLTQSEGLPEQCFVQRCLTRTGFSQCALVVDKANTKCDGDNGGNSRTNRAVLLGTVIPGALIAVMLAALAFWKWRRTQDEVEKAWLYEYMNTAQITVRTNAAFVNPIISSNNAAFEQN